MVSKYISVDSDMVSLLLSSGMVPLSKRGVLASHFGVSRESFLTLTRVYAWAQFGHMCHGTELKRLGVVHMFWRIS